MFSIFKDLILSLPLSSSLTQSEVVLPVGEISNSPLVDSRLLFLPLIPLVGALLSYLVGGKPKVEDDHHSDHDHGSSHDSHAHHGSHDSYKSGMSLSAIVATTASSLSFVLTLLLFTALGSGVSDSIVASAWSWIDAGDLNVDFKFRFDHLSAVMCLVITGIGSLIHLYASGYMAEDPHQPRFFAYLNLFLSAMLILVLGDNLLLTFVGWEGVGLCSYLLIGFWFKEMDNAKAGQKAFIVNRIGDAGFLLGMFTLFYYTGSLSPSDILAKVHNMPALAIEVAAILLLIGAAGKSAQIPLYIWLPDAMAGPTPVSALIHAATMVTSGVYMVARLAGLFSAAPHALLLVSIIGTLTAFIAATIALVQNDIKKVLAYSTVSQLGFMFMAIGAGAYSVGLYHVVTHAFFKALLFMAAGSVIVGCHHEQDMRKFGGLFKYMKFTGISYIAGTYAISGLPYGSGFFSKDSVLWATYSSTGLASTIEVSNGIFLNQALWGVGILTAALTAFYMTRSLFLTFFGTYRGHGTPHETSFNMVFPLLVLSVPSLIFSFLYGDTLLTYLAHWTRSDFLGGHHALLENHTYHQLETISMWVALISAGLSGLIYTFAKGLPAKISSLLSPIYKLLLGKWYVDELYNLVIVLPLRGISRVFFILFDRILIDGLLVTGSSVVVDVAGTTLKKIHSGTMKSSLSLMFSLFVFIILFWVIL